MKSRPATLTLMVFALTWLFAAQTGWSFYNPSTGKWLSRDPINEDGGKNLYGFVRNSPVSTTDALGLVGEGEGGRKWGLYEQDEQNGTFTWKTFEEFPRGEGNVILGIGGEAWIAHWRVRSWIVAPAEAPKGGEVQMSQKSGACACFMVGAKGAGEGRFWSRPFQNDARIHELDHIATYETYWNTMAYTIQTYTGVCMTRSKALCYRDATILLARAYRGEAELMSKQLDVESYHSKDAADWINQNQAAIEAQMSDALASLARCGQM